MKLQIMSDLHIAFGEPQVPATDADLIILAGDIGRPRQAIRWAYGLGKPVLYVPGNHEYYGGVIGQVISELRGLTAGTAIRACPPPNYTNATASGTSMASPHVAGAAAVLLQANPQLTPDQVRRALQATATPVTDAGGDVLAFWQIGYGFVNLDAAVDLVRGNSWGAKLPAGSPSAASGPPAAGGGGGSRGRRRAR